MNKFETAILQIMFAFAGIMVLAVLYCMLIWLPVNLYAEAKCLEQGYPESRVSVGLEQYCMTLDGSVTVRVDKQ
jgi:hypothetical protein